MGKRKNTFKEKTKTKKLTENFKRKKQTNGKRSLNNSPKSPNTFWYVITGIASGAINGLFGGGGGMIVVPMLVYFLKKDPKTAHATAIMIILPMSIVSGLFYAVFGTFQVRIGVPVGIGVIVGGTLGALLLNKLSSKWIVIVFSTLMAVAGVKMLIF